METKRTLYRDTDNRMLGGVASGLAEFCSYDVTAMRFLFVLGLFLLQGFVLTYIVAWIIIPRKNTLRPKKFSAIQIFLLLFICFLPVLAFIGLMIFLIIETLAHPF